MGLAHVEAGGARAVRGGVGGARPAAAHVYSQYKETAARGTCTVVNSWTRVTASPDLVCPHWGW